MKRIVILCDGTWRRSDAPYPTNVVRLAQAVSRRDQVVRYLPGVGSGRGSTTMARLADRMLGGAMGLGLDASIEAAYRFLALNHEPGDEIHLFGFSRGAYTARSLVGLLRTCGLPDGRDLRHVREAMDLYRRRGPGAHPDDPTPRAFRAEVSPMATGELEALERRAPRLRVAYLGVWDTVGALGVPTRTPLGERLNRAFAFHDTRLSAMVRRARHAVAIDERRPSFAPTLWEPPEESDCYQQKWFPGDHGAVGGGGAVTGLSAAALLWIAEGAREAGLALDARALDALAAEVDPLAPIDGPPPGVLDRLLRVGACDREGPRRLEEMSEAALRRWLHRGEPPGWPYRPAALKGLAEEMAPRRETGPRGGARPHG
jgi:uncharacterized protein (DUF2235 family)